MDRATTLSLADAADLLGTTKKALERRAERGTLRVCMQDGVRQVDVAELVRAGLAELAPQGGRRGPSPAAAAALTRRLEEAEADREALRAALEATESALRRARAESRELRQRLEALEPGEPGPAALGMAGEPPAPDAGPQEPADGPALLPPAPSPMGWLRRRRAGTAAAG